MDPKIKKWCSKIVAQRSDFEKQMAKVRAKYPLVALAYYMQKAIYTDILADMDVGLKYISLDEVAMAKESAKRSQKRMKLFRCLGSAKTIAEATQCFMDNPII
jgi:hypothetical protein